MIWTKELPTATATYEAGQALGQELVRLWPETSPSFGALITISGDLGAGKTTFCQGLGRGLKVFEPAEIISPTFTLANEYPGYIPLYHLDLYRLESAAQFYEAGLDEYLIGPGVTLVEWPEKVPSSIWPPERLDLAFRFAEPGRELISTYAGSWWSSLRKG